MLSLSSVSLFHWHISSRALHAYSITTDMPINYSLEVTPEAATTPEPSTLILLLTGAGGILSLAARRREGRVTQV